jgi:hypothetical protein
MVGSGAYPDIPAACRATVRVDKTYTPKGVDYTAAYEKFRALDQKLNIKE